MVRASRLAGQVWAVCAVLFLLLAAGGSAAPSPHCAFKVTGPQTRPDNTLVSNASFRCVRAYRWALAKVAVQERRDGQWVTAGQQLTAIEVARGKSYTVIVKVPCKASTGFTGVKIRTLFVLRTSSWRFVLPTQADPALCTFNSAS